MTEPKLDNELAEKAVKTIQMLSADAIQKANSGHPGLPMGMADVAFVLWSRYLRFNPDDPDWLNRDRFILSAGHGSMLLYSLLHLFEFDLPMEQLESFRQWGSLTPGHPEAGLTPGVEVTTGPLGQGFGNGVGMAIASQFLAAYLNEPDFKPIDHFVYAICSDGDIMEGVASEAASLAGHLGLGNIIYLYDDNHITIEGETELAFSEDVGQRFEAYGWHVLRVDGHNHQDISAAIRTAQAQVSRPTLIICRTRTSARAARANRTLLTPTALRWVKMSLRRPRRTSAGRLSQAFLCRRMCVNCVTGGPSSSARSTLSGKRLSRSTETSIPTGARSGTPSGRSACRITSRRS